MRVYLANKNGRYDATADYSEQDKSVTVLKGSKVSTDIAHSEKFRGSKSIASRREGNVSAENVVLHDIRFSSFSTAANFVTGRSTNGLLAWRDKNGKTVKELFNSEENK